jgi:hypothetical protein
MVIDLMRTHKTAQFLALSHSKHYFTDLKKSDAGVHARLRRFLGVNGALACSPASEAIQKELAARRTRDEAVLRKRLERARSEGDLPEDVSPADLARFIATVLRGMAVQAKSGASRQELRRVAAMALRVWPG